MITKPDEINSRSFQAYLIKTVNVRLLTIEAYLYNNGIGRIQNVLRAALLYDKAAQLGDPLAQTQLADLFFWQTSLPINLEKSRQTLLPFDGIKALHNPNWQTLLNKQHFTNPAEKPYSPMITMLEMAANQDYLPAQITLGGYYTQSLMNLTFDESKFKLGVSYLTKGAEAGDHQAIMRLLSLEKKIELPHCVKSLSIEEKSRILALPGEYIEARPALMSSTDTFAERFSALTKLAAIDYLPACYDVAWLHASGQGTKQNTAKANTEFFKLSERHLDANFITHNASKVKDRYKDINFVKNWQVFWQAPPALIKGPRNFDVSRVDFIDIALSVLFLSLSISNFSVGMLTASILLGVASLVFAGNAFINAFPHQPVWQQTATSKMI
jgi:TPR repeat protein